MKNRTTDRVNVMIGYYNYTVILTYISALTALYGIFMAIQGRPLAGIVCLLVSACCDMFDGQIARTKKDRTEQEKKFGIQIDSLSDVIAFGVLPAAIGYALGMTEWYYMLILGAYMLAALIRLAYFNVSEEERQSKTSEKRKSYEGLPVPNCAIGLPLVMCFRNILGDALTPVFAGMMLLIAVLFVARFRVVKVTGKALLIFVGVGAVLLTFVLLGLGK